MYLYRLAPFAGQAGRAEDDEGIRLRVTGLASSCVCFRKWYRKTLK